jgi:hypothetical protein
MARTLTALGACLTLGLALSAAPAPTEQPAAYIDLAPHLNVKLKDNLHSDRFPNNNLASLPTGKQTFAGVKFQIGDGIVQLGSAQVQSKPAKVEGIKVGRTFAKLHILHATGYSADEEIQIAKYVVRYDDKSTAEVEVVYGKDVVDWWAYPDQKAPTRSKVAWEGENEAAKGFEAKIKLYLTTWENPHPKKKVVSLDYVATAPDKSPAPFCVAITAEDK